ncbi:IS5 family transposase [Kitasatospora sp. NPDC058190]|uniref:IS5 family transposase n=1 Tax=Kitasatospora sp. NPDC058190 TaxID=3346371 RepID=UPI0036DCF9E2
MTDAEWEVTLAALPTPPWLEGRGGRPARYCERQLIDAVRYVDDSGCKWRQLPADFPPRSAVYAYFQRTAENGALAEYHDRLRARVRESEGRAAEPTAAIIDSQSVPAAETVAAGHRGYDAGKNIDGRKRHIAVDTLGLLLACLVTPACVPDRDAAEPLLEFLHDQHETHQPRVGRRRLHRPARRLGPYRARADRRCRQTRRRHQRLHRPAPPLGRRAHSVRHEALCLYPRLSREELGRRFLGRMTHLDPKGEGDKSMSGNR